MKQQLLTHLIPRPKWLGGLLGASSLLAVALGAGHAAAQADVSPPPPNVMLLVDTSGSMDYKTSSNSFPSCKYSGSTDTGAVSSEHSRWTDLVEVLTGSIDTYQCQDLDRNSNAFRTEYALSGAPYDALYANHYHRPVANGCVAGPGTLDPNPALFPAGAIKYHDWNNTLSSCTFKQASDGILDAFQPDIRFGLMTFDTEPRAAKDVTGLWSYYVSSSRKGEPIGCTTPQDQEVGVRNSSAPPWEGRAVGFGNPALGVTEYMNRNAMIQQVLLATRPYGATPIAGMLDDARTYFLTDATDDPLDSSFKFGPMNDPALLCRHKSIVLLSDGQPNMDLRPACEGGICPYDKPETIAQDLKSKGIEVYVIGFALSSVTIGGVTKSCSDKNVDWSPTGACADLTNAPLQACCALNRIAAAGGPTHSVASDPDWTFAHFADSPAQLRTALSQAIGGNFKSTTRTPFVTASSSGFVTEKSDLNFARSFRFAASFKPGKLDTPWVGAVNRARYVCTADSLGVLRPKLLDADANMGDKFVDNVNVGGPAARKIFSVLGDGTPKSDNTMRPNLASGVDDGVGSYFGLMNASAYTSAGFVSAMPATALAAKDGDCGLGTTAAQCSDRYLKWLVGLDNGTTFQRCPNAASCNLISETYHSIPRAVAGRPSQFLVDQSYQTFVTAQVTAKRPSMLYASSNDGFLHAFKISQVDKSDTTEAIKVVDNSESNELWTFVPPGVLTGIGGIYPASHQRLLDGSPAIKEVVATADNTLTNYKFTLERTLAQARGGLGAWRTILVQSYGTQRPGYFAVDITDPVLTPNGGPKFLWQLSTDSGGKPLFGDGGGTPLITTVYLGGKEVAVAVLPGGYSKDTLGLGSCSRGKTDYSAEMPNAPAPRASVPCYLGTALQARSLTVVRLDSGQILRTFRRAEAEVPGLVGKLVWTQALLDSPMTGQPVAYPGGVGSVADRVFIGDQDGALWRLNFASGTGAPSDWKLEMFFDGFPGAAPFSHAYNDGQPVISAPIISVDRVGNLTVAFSTGQQEAVGAGPVANYVWSLTEKPSADRTLLTPKVNWYKSFTGSGLAGDRVIGEMALFNGDLFFSTVGPGTSTDSCSSGSGKVWGMHYLDATGIPAGMGGTISPTLSSLVNSNGYIDATTLLGSDAHAFLSGVSVAQQPTCDNLDDASSAAIGGATPGKFQLIIPTGDTVSTTTVTGITPIKEGGNNGVAIDLKAPPASLIVDSWASIVE